MEGFFMELSSDKNEVLFQKLGNTWYVFTQTESDVVYSVLPEGLDPYSVSLELYEVIEGHIKKVSSLQDIQGLDIAS